MCCDNNSFTTFIELWPSSTSEDLTKKNEWMNIRNIRLFEWRNDDNGTESWKAQIGTCITSSIPRSRHPPALGSYSCVPCYWNILFYLASAYKGPWTMWNKHVSNPSTGDACKKPSGCNAHPSYQTVKKTKRSSWRTWDFQYGLPAEHC